MAFIGMIFAPLLFGGIIGLGISLFLFIVPKITGNKLKNNKAPFRILLISVLMLSPFAILLVMVIIGIFIAYCN